MADLFLDGGNAFSTFDQQTPAPPAPVFAPDIATYATRTPYVTAAEFIEAGTGVDVAQLVPGGSTGEQSAALVRNIAQASAVADTHCRKILAATEDVDAGYFLVRDGVCSVPVRYTPALEVVGISTGPAPWQMTDVGDLSRVGIVPPKLVQFAADGCPRGPRGRLFVQLTYVNGWTCTTLAAGASLGDAQVTLASNLGVYPGMVLTVDDGANTETVTVDASYVPGAAGAVQLAAPLAHDHAAGAAFSAIPADVKRAVVLLTAAIVKTRGNRAFVMGPNGVQPTLAATQAGGNEDIQLARELLADYRRAA